jgi:putative membrane protein
MSQVNSREIVNARPEVLKGLAAGTIGGLVASWVMDEFQSALIKLSNRSRRNESSESSSANNGGQSQNGAAEPATAEAEPATVKAAEFISEKIFGHQLARREKKIAGDAVHYATGAASGAVYGIAAELAPEVTAGAGLPFGTAVWLVVDEGAVPLFGLAKGPTEYPLSTHVYALASHFVYGISTEVVRSALRRTMLK